MGILFVSQIYHETLDGFHLSSNQSIYKYLQLIEDNLVRDDHHSPVTLDAELKFGTAEAKSSSTQGLTELAEK